MVRKILSAVLLVAIGLTTVVSLCCADKDGVLMDEKRKITKFPKSPRKFRRKEVQEYTNTIEQYFLDRIVFREQWLKLATLSPSSKESSLYMDGRGKWLYLGNAANRYVDRLCGKEVDTPENVALKTRIFRGLQDVCERHGVAFHIMIGPNKANVYPEYLPRSVIPAAQRYSDPLLASLKEAGVDVFDPTELLKASKEKGYMYWQMDVHWNQLGAYIATNAFLEHCGLPTMPECKFRVEGVHRGDLYDVAGRLGMFQAKGDNYAVEWPEMTPEMLSDKKILVLGDSFSFTPIEHLKHLYPNLKSEHYGKALVLHSSLREQLPKVMDQYLSSLPEKPEAILWIQVERFFADGFFRTMDQKNAENKL